MNTVAQEGLGEGVFDQIEVRRVGRKEQQPGAPCLNLSTRRDALVDWQVVQDDDVTGFQRRGGCSGINRIVKELRLTGAMALARGSVTILDPKKLVGIAGFDENYLHRRLRQPG